MAIWEPGTRIRHRKLDLPVGDVEVWLDQDDDRVTLHTEHDHGGGSSNWSRCRVENCLGEAVISGEVCVLHADDAIRSAYFAELAKTHSRLSLHGVVVTDDLWNSIRGSPILSMNTVQVPISAAGAEFRTPVDLRGYDLPHYFELTGAILRKPFSLIDCQVHQRLFARFAFFKSGPASFTRVTFSAPVDLAYAHAESVAFGFTSCTFHDSFIADGLTGSLLIKHCMFKSDFSLRSANADMVILDDCDLGGMLDLRGTHCAALRLPSLQATVANQLGPVHIKNDCTLTNCQFAARVNLQVNAKELDLSGTRFLAGGSVVAHEADIALNHVSTGGPLRIAGMLTGMRPRITALQNADAGSMSFAYVDMSDCAFYGAHDLGGITIEPTVTLANTPAWWQTKRRCVEDEFVYRRSVDGPRGWGWKGKGTTEDAGTTNATQTSVPLGAAQVASVYRELRRSFETKSNEPGAADFYYGEMEMRRHSAEAGWAERAIVWAYWVFSGYGLRALRAFLALAVLIIIGSVIMAPYGFAAGRKPMTDSVLFTLRAALPGLGNDAVLTHTGEVVLIVLSLLGTVLSALGLLALRGRVRR